MARVTREDCLNKEGEDKTNLFELVLLSARLGKQIYTSNSKNLAIGKHKPSVAALKMIASGAVKINKLRESYINDLVLSFRNEFSDVIESNDKEDKMEDEENLDSIQSMEFGNFIDEEFQDSDVEMTEEEHNMDILPYDKH